MKDILKVIADNVKRYRQLRGLTQEDLAFKIGISESYIGKIETARQSFSIITLNKIAKGLEVPPQALLGKITQQQIYKLQNKELKEILDKGTKEERDFIFTSAEVLLKKRKKKKR